MSTDPHTSAPDDPESELELVDKSTPKFGVVLKSYRAHRAVNSSRQSLVAWVAVVKTNELTTAMVTSVCH